MMLLPSTHRVSKLASTLILKGLIRSEHRPAGRERSGATGEPENEISRTEAALVGFEQDDAGAEDSPQVQFGGAETRATLCLFADHHHAAAFGAAGALAQHLFADG